jgi:Carboxypeptidase regulatory-like domain
MVQSPSFGFASRSNGFQWLRLPPWAPRELRRSMLFVLYCSLAFLMHGAALSQQIKPIDPALPAAPTMGIQAAQETPGESLGTISGTVADQNENYVFSARVRLMLEGHTEEREATSDEQGRFVFPGVAAGPFRLIISAPSFAPQEVSGILHPGETLEVPEISLSIPATTTEVHVSVTNYELAEEQVKIEETQRVLGVIPNFYVTYQKDTLPLRPKQKFELAWKTSVDPVTFAATGGIAGVEQAQNGFSGYGQGSQGYAKRFGASYADTFIGTMIGGAILPTVLKQDPRYYYKGTGSTRSRVLYAMANAVICKGDNGHWQPDYSGILGSLAAGGVSNLYYPASSRGAWLTFENTFIGIGGSAIGNLFQEFLVRKLTPHTRGPQTINP